MKVLVVSGMYPTQASPSSGIFVHRQVVESVAQGVDVQVIRPVPLKLPWLARRGRHGGADVRRVDGVPVTYLTYRHLPLRLSAGWEAASLTGALERHVGVDNGGHFDLVHAHALFPAGFVAMRLAQRLGVPCVVSARGSDVHRHPWANRGIARYTRATIAGSDRITAVSHALARGVCELTAPAHAIDVVYNGVDLHRFRASSSQTALRSRLGLPPDGIVLCTVASLVREKGVLEAVEAFRILRSRFDRLALAIVGDGPLRKTVAARAGSGKVDDRVVFAGAVPPAAVADWLNAADVFVLPSYNEGLPNVVLEAMACRLPVVATDVGGIPEAAPDGVVGRLVPRMEVMPLVEALSQLIEDPALRRRFGDAAYERVRSLFSWERSARELGRIYQEVRERHEKRNRRAHGTVEGNRLGR